MKMTSDNTGKKAKAAPSGARGPYSSASMAERRERLIEASLSMLLEGRGDDFTLRYVAKKADVSLTVLYNQFGSKEGLVAAAMKTFYMRQAPSRRPARPDLAGLLDEIDEMATITTAVPDYVRSLCDLYFLHSGNGVAYEQISYIARATFLPWLDRVTDDGDLLPGLDRRNIEDILTGDRWHALSDWIRGHVPHEIFADTVKLRFLFLARGITSGKEHERISAALAEVSARLASAPVQLPPRNPAEWLGG